MDCILILKSVPDVIWGTIIGSTITLFGTWLQGRNNLKMLFRKEEIDNHRLKDQRNYELRKDNYLTALSSISELMNILMDFTKPGSDFDEFGKKMQEVLKKLSSLDIVADSNTLIPVHNFQKYYFQCSVELMNLKIPVEQLVIDERIAQNWYNFFSNKISENIEQLKQNPYGDPQQRQEYVEFLNKRYEDDCQERDKYSSELSKLRSQILHINLDLKRNYIDKLIVMQKHASEFVQHARNDLGLSALPIDSIEIGKFYESFRLAMDTTFDNVKSLMQKDEENDNKEARAKKEE
jgi:hypothetical protein